MTILPAKRSSGASNEESKEAVQQTVGICVFFFVVIVDTCILEQCRVCGTQKGRTQSDIPNN